MTDAPRCKSILRSNHHIPNGFSIMLSDWSKMGNGLTFGTTMDQSYSIIEKRFVIEKENPNINKAR